MYAFKQGSQIIFECPSPKLHLAELQAWRIAMLPPQFQDSQQGGAFWQLPLRAYPGIEPLLPTATSWRPLVDQNHSSTELSAFILGIFS